MSEHAPDRLWAGIDIPKTIAGVLAAVSAAVVGSFLGVAGTLVGAAVASIVGSVGTEIYHRSIERGKQRLASTFVTAPAAVGTPPVVAAEEEVPSEPEPPVARKYRWGRVAMVAGALFVLAMGALSVFELTAGKSVADAVGNKSSSSSTVGSVFGGKDKKEKPATNTTPSPSAKPSETATSEPSTDPSAPTSTEPSADPSAQTSTEPSVDPAAPTGDATSEAPALDSGDSGDGGTGGNGGNGGDSGTGGGGASTDSGGEGGGASADTITPEPDKSAE